MNFINLFPSLDIFILFLFVAIVILHLLFIKKSKLLTGLVALYASFVIVLVLPMFNATVLSWLQAHPFGRIAVFWNRDFISHGAGRYVYQLKDAVVVCLVADGNCRIEFVVNYWNIGLANRLAIGVKNINK